MWVSVNSLDVILLVIKFLRILDDTHEQKLHIASLLFAFQNDTCVIPLSHRGHVIIIHSFVYYVAQGNLYVWVWMHYELSQLKECVLNWAIISINLHTCHVRVGSGLHMSKHLYILWAKCNTHVCLLFELCYSAWVNSLFFVHMPLSRERNRCTNAHLVTITKLTHTHTHLHIDMHWHEYVPFLQFLCFFCGIYCLSLQHGIQ